MEKFLKIPERNRDLRRRVGLKVAYRIISYPVWICLWTLGFVSFASKKAEGFETYVKSEMLTFVLLIAFVLISGLFISGFYKLFGKRSYIAKITSMRMANDYGVSTNSEGKTSMAMKTNCVLTLTDKRGKRHKKAVQIRESGFNGYYENGNTVAVHRELQYPENISPDKGLLICMVCGHVTKNDSEAARGCPLCGRSLIVREKQ